MVRGSHPVSFFNFANGIHRFSLIGGSTLPQNACHQKGCGIMSLGLPVRGNTSHKPGNITGRPGILPPEAGNITVTVLLPAGPTVILPAGGNIPAPFGNVTGWPGILPPEAGNVTVNVLLPAGPTVIFPAGGNIPAPFGNVTGWREYYRPLLGTSPGRRGYSRPLAGAFPAGAGILPARWVDIPPPLRAVCGGIKCPAVKWAFSRFTTVGSNVAQRHAESKQYTVKWGINSRLTITIGKYIHSERDASD